MGNPMGIPQQQQQRRPPQAEDLGKSDPLDFNVGAYGSMMNMVGRFFEDN